MQVALLSDAHEGKQWFQGKPPHTYVMHAVGRGAMLFTRREADVSPHIGTCSLDVKASEQAGAVQVTIATFTPGLEAVLISTDGGAWIPTVDGPEQQQARQDCVSSSCHVFRSGAAGKVFQRWPRG